MVDLRGRAALVTGGSRGIGAATARLLARCGADVAVAYHRRRDEAAAIVHDVQALGRRATAVAADLTDPAAAEAMVDTATRALGALHIFVGNAGTWPVEDVAVRDLGTERWSRTVRENLDAMFYATRACARQLRPGGRIVLVASTAGQRGEAFHADYAASKGGMISYVKSLAVELAPQDITVNAVAPGWVDTEMVAPVMAQGRERIAAGIPLGRIATAEDIAGPIVFLCSEQARHVTGEILNVNGGSVLCG